MSQNQPHATTLTLFCKVVDNYGDIGICWRLSRQLQAEHGIAVTLWVDDLLTFQRLCPEIRTDQSQQEIAGIQIRHWAHQEDTFTANDIADIVIEFFGCDIPPAYIAAMSQRSPQPVWLNLEGLTAEEWVEGCHSLPSPHPRYSLTKYFFFPGFTPKTGGLLFESGIEQRQSAFIPNNGKTDFLKSLGLSEAEIQSELISLFCYPHAPVAALFDVWKNSAHPITCLVPEGVASEIVSAFLDTPPVRGTMVTRGALTVRVIPLIPQTVYDQLLWSCDINFVRGEDSFVRAQLAGKPFVWHIYPQENALHHVKLRAFLKRYTGSLSAQPSWTANIHNFSLAWNGVTQPSAAEWKNLWQEMIAAAAQSGISLQWKQEILKHGDLCSNLLHFVAAIQEKTVINAV